MSGNTQLFKLNRKMTVVLKSYELDLLEQILIHRILHAKSIHEFIQEMAGRKLNSNAISNRLNRLVKTRILSRLTKNISLTRAKVPRYYYKLDIKGFRCLIESGGFDYDELRNRYRLSKESVIPTNHTDAMSKLANQVYINCTKTLGADSFQHLRGVEGEIRKRNNRGKKIKEYGLVIPDWILKKEKHLICIEMDTGTQNQNVIRKKIIFYNKLREEIEQEGYQISLVFAVLDESIDVVEKFKKGDRTKRIASLKEHIAAFTYVNKEKPIIVQNTYVATAKRIPDIVKNLLLNKKVNQHEFLHSWVHSAAAIFQRQGQLMINRGSLPYDSQVRIPILKISNKSMSQHLIPTYGFEGLVMQYEIQQLLENVVMWNRTYPDTENIIVVCYEDTLAAEHDIYGFEVQSKLYKTDLRTWEVAKSKEEKQPKMLRITGPHSQQWF